MRRIGYSLDQIQRCDQASMPSSSDDQEDELDRITKLYETEAKEALAKAQDASRRAKRQKQSPSGAHATATNAALATPLPPENKGFQLLARMGYAPGAAIGKTGAGLTEPVAVEMKPNRLGIGAVSKKAIQRESRRQKEDGIVFAENVAAEQAAADLDLQQHTYRERTAGSFASRHMEEDLKRALKACEVLDTRQGLKMNSLWPIEGAEEGLGADEEDTAQEAWRCRPIEERLVEVLGYLRQQHCYCIYCGVEYEGAADMAANCPGPDESDH